MTSNDTWSWVFVTKKILCWPTLVINYYAYIGCIKKQKSKQSKHFLLFRSFDLVTNNWIANTCLHSSIIYLWCLLIGVHSSPTRRTICFKKQGDQYNTKGNISHLHTMKILRLISNQVEKFKPQKWIDRHMNTSLQAVSCELECYRMSRWDWKKNATESYWK